MNALRRFIQIALSMTDRLTILFLPHLPLGTLKSILANHQNPAVRRKALIELGGDISNSCHLNQGIRLVMDHPLKSNIKIGNRVSVAPNVQFICNSGPHPESLLLKINYVREKLTKDKKITIGDEAWIGAGAIILPGVKIGKCSIVGAGALVIEDVPEYSVVAGTPATIIRNLEKESHNI